MKPTTGSIVNLKINEHAIRPMIVTQVFPHEYGDNKPGCNGTVFLDGWNDLKCNPVPEVIGTMHGCKPVAPDVPLISVYSVKQGDGVGEWNWPETV